MPDLVKQWKKAHPNLSRLGDEINAENERREKERQRRQEEYRRQDSQFQAQTNRDIADSIKMSSPLEVERRAQEERVASRNAVRTAQGNALTPELEARRQQAAGVNRAPNAYQQYMMSVMNSLPPQEETRSTDELRRDMNRQNRQTNAASRMAADEANRSMQDQGLLFNPVYTTNLQTLGKTMEAQQLKADRATALYQALSTQRREDEERSKVSDLMKNPDFQKNSQGSQVIADGGMVTPTGSNPTARLYRDIYYRGQNNTDRAASNVTDEEAAVFFYLWNTQGAKAAETYYKDYVENRASQRQMETLQNQARAYGEYDPIGASVASVGTNLMSGVGLIDMAWQNLVRTVGITDKNKPLNYYSTAQGFGLKTDAYRQGASDFLEQLAADELRRNYPGLKDPEKYAKVASFLYQTGMSMADSGVAALLVSIGVPEPLTLANMGAAAGTRAIRDARERGATDGQALAFGISSAIMEALFEKISLDKVLEPSYAGTAKAHLLNAWNQSFTEGSEEVMTTVANTVMDQMILGDKSELFTRQKQLMEQGVSERTALRAAFRTWGTELLGDAIGGFLSGAGMGGVKELNTGLNVFLDDFRRDYRTAHAINDALRQNLGAAAAQEAALTPTDNRDIVKENIEIRGIAGNREGGVYESGERAERAAFGEGSQVSGEVEESKRGVRETSAGRAGTAPQTSEGVSQRSNSQRKDRLTAARIAPKEGSLEQKFTEKAKNQYSLNTFTIKADVWNDVLRNGDTAIKDKDIPSMACIGGDIYIREGITEEELQIGIPHEANHAMMVFRYEPYLSFLDDAPDYLNLDYPYTTEVLDALLEHIEKAFADLEKKETIDNLYDELLSVLYGKGVSGTLAGYSSRFGYYIDYRQIVNDFDELYQRLDNIHKSFQIWNKQRQSAEESSRGTEIASGNITAVESGDIETAYWLMDPAPRRERTVWQQCLDEYDRETARASAVPQPTKWQAYLDEYDRLWAELMELASKEPEQQDTVWKQCLREYDEAQRREEALKTVEILGYVPEEYAELFGVEPGTSWLVVRTYEQRRKLRAERQNAEGEHWDPERPAVDGSADFSDREAFERTQSVRMEDDAPENAVDNSPERGIIKIKFRDRVTDMWNGSENVFEAEDIEKELESSVVGGTASEYIQENGINVIMDYSLDTSGVAGEWTRKDITVYAAEHVSARDVSATIVHETYHMMYGWNNTQEDEVNCRLMELMHLNGDVTDKEIKKIVRFVRASYSEYPEGNLYGFGK
ncbi:MAG: hypothetical protein IKP17_03820 [Oscillospiraceae bacterium]|nr:hypothetical protein [Oscillospiraceae bacterium]MBR3545577.1 hypothetical protein [Oscillospiraceae bacterium]MBR4691866.1 hypothetical protein [Oscillospiraceae bacterium]